MVRLNYNIPDTKLMRALLGSLLGVVFAASLQLFAMLPAIRQLTHPLDDLPRALLLRAMPGKRYRGAEKRVCLVVWPAISETANTGGINSERGRADIAMLTERLLDNGAVGVGLYLPLNPYLNFSELASVATEELTQAPRLDWLAEVPALDHVMLQLTPAVPPASISQVYTFEQFARMVGRETPLLQSSLREAKPMLTLTGPSPLLALRFERSAGNSWSMAPLANYDGLKRLATLMDNTTGRHLTEWTSNDVWLNLAPYPEQVWASYSADDVVQGKISPTHFRDTLVLVVTRESLAFTQVVSTPVGNYHTPYLTAATLTMAIADAASVPLAAEWNLILLMVCGIAVGIVSSISPYKLSGLMGIGISLIALVCVVAASWFFYVWIAPLPLILTIALTWWAGIVWHSRLDASAALRVQRDQLKLLTQELQAAQSSLLNYEESERRELASEIHDQTLSDLRQLTQMVSRLKHEPTQTVMTELHARLDRAADEARRIVNRLRPSVLDNIGFLSACRAHLREMANLSAQGFVAKFQCDLTEDELTLTMEVKTALYRIVQESINNISKHAQAESVKLTFIMDESVLQITIEDDGKGFCYDAPRKGGHGGHGLIGMRARANSIGATIEWKIPLSGKGTLVEVSFPLHVEIERKEQL